MNFFKKKSNQKGNQRKFKKKNPAHWYKYFITAAVILITVLYLKPLVSSGWIADDASHSLSWYQAKMTNMSLSDRLTSYFITGGKVPGRFFPFAGYAFLLFTIAPNIVLYKSIVLCIIVVSIFLFYHLVKRLSGNEHTALLACLIMPAFFQFRFFYDPILYGSAIMPIIFSLTFLSLIFLDKFLETYKWKFYILSFTIYIISLLTYEITYVFFLLHFSLIYFRRKNLQDVFRYGAVFLGALGIAVIGSINERLKFGAQTVATYNVHFVPKVYFLTVLKQLYAALPLSYSLSNPSQILPQTFGYRLSHIQLLDLVIVVLFLICYFFLIQKVKFSATVRKWFLIFGLLLFILPGLMIALSAVYQQLLVFGIGYLPVYIQYFGACLFFIGMASYIVCGIKSIQVKQLLSIVVAVIFTTIYLINLQNNRFVVEKFNTIYWYPRNILEVSAKNGIFAQVPANATLVIETDDGLSLEYPSFIYSLTNRNIFAINSKGVMSWYQSITKSSSIPLPGVAEKYFFDKGPVYFFRYWSDSINRGYVVVTKVSDFRTDSKFKKTAVKVKSLDVFVLGDFSPDANVSFNKISLDVEGKVETQTMTTVSRKNFKILKKLKKGTVVRIATQLESDSWVDFQSVRLNPSPEPPRLINLCETDVCLTKASEDFSHIEMGNSPYEDTLLLKGWDVHEDGHRWANSLNSTLRLVKHGSVQFLTIEALSLVKDQTVSIYINDEFLGTQELTTEWNIYKIPFPYLRNEDLYKIKFIFTKITSPAKLGISSDLRELTVDFRKIFLE